MQIVIAWAEKTKLIKTGRQVMRDMNWFPEFTTDWEGKAAMWLSSGTSADHKKALEYARADSRLVFTFDPPIEDPLTKAREMAVIRARKSERQAA